MVIGNAMTASAVALNRLGDEIADSRARIEATLALGATAREAAAPTVRRALRSGMIALVDSTKTTGLIFFPGTMVGMLLAGADPTDAVRLQLILLYALLGSVAIAAPGRDEPRLPQLLHPGPAAARALAQGPPHIGFGQWRRPIVFSGIQPTGRKHLGNYIGAIRQYVEGQDRGEPAIFCIVDLHAISVPYDPAELRERLYDTTAILLAAGLDPERCILFRQSDVREHTELDLAALARSPPTATSTACTSSRTSRPKQRELVSAGALLLPGAAGRRRARLPGRRGPGRRGPAPARRADAGDRPPLQRALRRDPGRARAPDPGGRRPDHGPAGARAEDVDDRRHRGRAPSTSSTSPTRSARSSAARSPTPAARSRARRGQGRDRQPDRHPRRRPRHRPGRGRSRVRGLRLRRLQEGGRRGVVEFLAPVRERYAELRPDEAALEAALAAGAEKARAIASGTLAEVRDRMGIGPSASKLTRVTVAELDLDLDVFAGPVRPAAGGRPARGGQPARGRAGRGRRRLRRAPRATRASWSSRWRPSSWS